MKICKWRWSTWKMAMGWWGEKMALQKRLEMTWRWYEGNGQSFCRRKMAEEWQKQNSESKIGEEFLNSLEWLLPPHFIELRGQWIRFSLLQQTSTWRLLIDGVLHSGATDHRRTVESEASRSAEKTLHASRDGQLGLPGSSGGVEKVPAASNGVKTCKKKILFRLKHVWDDDEQCFHCSSQSSEVVADFCWSRQLRCRLQTGLKSASGSP